MNLTPQVCENALLRLRTASKAQLHAVRHYFDRRHLEASLASLVEAARGHEAHGVPAGSPQYLVLYQQSERLITDYCQRWRRTADQLNAELPALGRLRRLAEPPLRQARTVSRTEPPVSVPTAHGTSRAATATPDPLLEPPGVRANLQSQGFQGVPIY
jgi:hypothetical protein